MRMQPEQQDINRLTYDENGDIIVVYENNSAAISLPLGFKELNGVQLMSLGRFQFVQQLEGFPLLLGQYPDLTGVFHLSSNEVLITTQRQHGAEGGYIRCVGEELYHEKVQLPNRRRPSGLSRMERQIVAAYADNYTVYAMNKTYLVPAQRGEVKVATLNNRIAVACGSEVSLLDENLLALQRFDWGVQEELRDIKFSPDGLLMHVAYKRTLLSFDLDG